MDKKLQLDTILAHAGIKTDEATGALTTPLHFQRPISIQNLENPLDMTIRARKTQREVAWRRR